MDVSNLIPVVTESLSTFNPGIGAGSTGGDAAGNVWASGAATSAFDAFGDHVPAHSASGSAMDDAHAFAADVIDHPQDAAPVGLDHLGADTTLDPVADHASPLLDPSVIDDAGAVIDDVAAAAPLPLDDWAAGVVEHIHPDTPDFDIFH